MSKGRRARAVAGGCAAVWPYYGVMAWRLERGANVGADGRVTFSVWAPRQKALSVRVLDPVSGAPRGELPMTRGPDGVFAAEAGADLAPAGSDYVYLLPEVGARPDPVSRHQPRGVHAPSRIVAADRFAWTDAGWRGVPRADLVAYELHVGTFSPEGTFDGVAARLPHLRDLGVTAVELMPVAAFPGDRNWGYDGVYLYAPHTAYGGPEGLKRLLDAAMRTGSRSSSTSSTTTSARKGTTSTTTVPTSRTAIAPPGATRSTSTARTAIRCGGSSSTTPCTG